MASHGERRVNYYVRLYLYLSPVTALSQQRRQLLEMLPINLIESPRLRTVNVDDRNRLNHTPSDACRSHKIRI